ncbi:MAG: hypothetical protein ABIY52_08030 [Gemmatimonadaceae bacterium]
MPAKKKSKSTGPKGYEFVESLKPRSVIRRGSYWYAEIKLMTLRQLATAEEALAEARLKARKLTSRNRALSKAKRELEDELEVYRTVANYSNVAHDELQRLIRKYGPREYPRGAVGTARQPEHPYHRHYNYFQAAERRDFEPRHAVQGGTGGLEKK